MYFSILKLPLLFFVATESFAQISHNKAYAFVNKKNPFTSGPALHFVTLSPYTARNAASTPKSNSNSN